MAAVDHVLHSPRSPKEAFTFPSIGDQVGIDFAEDFEDMPKILQSVWSKQDLLEKRLERWFAEVIDRMDKDRQTNLEAAQAIQGLSAINISRPDFARTHRPVSASKQEAPAPEASPRASCQSATIGISSSWRKQLESQAKSDAPVLPAHFSVHLQKASAPVDAGTVNGVTTTMPTLANKKSRIPRRTHRRTAAPPKLMPEASQSKEMELATSVDGFYDSNTLLKKDADEILAEWQQVRRPVSKRLRPTMAPSRSFQLEIEAQHHRPNTVKRTRLIAPSKSNMCKYTTYQIVSHPFFDALCAFMIISNSVLIGFSVEWLTTHDNEELWSVIFGHICNIFFIIELLMRMVVQGKMYFVGEDKTWNFFDFSLVVFSVVDFVLEISNYGSSSVGSGMKTIKMLRIVRIFRVFRFFRELSLLAIMIADSIRSLMWALVMLAIIVYVFAICFTSSASEYLNKDPDWNNPVSHIVHKRFGSLPRTVYSLILSMLQGVSWEAVSDPLMKINGFVTGLFFFYVAFTMLAVLNIITGVFVDNAVETARTQRDFLVEKEMELRERYVMELHDIFEEMDADASGTLCLDEIQMFFNDVRVQSYFQALGLDPHDTERLFRLIDQDGSGEVAVQEFLDGCLRLKGEARSIDVHAVMYDCKELIKQIHELRFVVHELAARLPAKVQ